MHLVRPTGPGPDRRTRGRLEAGIHQPTGQGVSAGQFGRPRPIPYRCARRQSVSVSFRDSSTFTKGEDGAWVGYTRPLDEGFHYYTITIDGAEVPDPNSKYYFGAMRGAAALRFPPKTRTSMPSSRFLTVNCAKSCSSRRAPIRLVAHLSTLRLVMTRIWKDAIRSYICSTVGEKTNSAGVPKATPV